MSKSNPSKFDLALRFALRYISQVGQLTTADALVHCFFSSSLAQQYVMIDAYIRESRVSRDFWDAVLIINEALSIIRASRPPELVDWSTDVIHDVTRQRRKRLRPRPTERQPTIVRDFVILMFIAFVEAWLDLKPTRSVNGITQCSPEGGHGCDAVGMAAGVFGYRAVEKLWEKREERVWNLYGPVHFILDFNVPELGFLRFRMI